MIISASSAPRLMPLWNTPAGTEMVSPGCMANDSSPSVWVSVPRSR